MIASRIGADGLGQEIRRGLLSRGMSDRFLQTDTTYPTGTVSVEVDAEGKPNFAIRYPAAWDFLEWNLGWRALAQSADAVAFGSLAQRSAVAHNTILNFLDQTRPEALRIFDVNLRQCFYSLPNVTASMQRAGIVKLNHEELPVVAELLDIPVSDHRRFAATLIQRFGLNLVCITRGAQGSVLASSTDFHEHPGFRVEVKDTVGSGDAFTAGLVHEYLRAGSLARMNHTANQMGAWVASCAGAMPPPPADELRKTLEQLPMA
jgi:fructokinase